jgi:hypothetical protein
VLANLHITGKAGANERGATNERKLMPPPATIIDRLKAWSMRWFTAGVDCETGCTLFTPSTVGALSSLMKHVLHWRYSGERSQVLRCGVSALDECAAVFDVWPLMYEA